MRKSTYKQDGNGDGEDNVFDDDDDTDDTDDTHTMYSVVQR